MAVRLFVGNLSYATTEADLRAHFGAVAPPSQVVLPVDRETGRPRGFAFVEFIDRAHAEDAIQRFNGQVFNGRPLAVSEARAREDRGPGGPRPGGPPPPGPAALVRAPRRPTAARARSTRPAARRPRRAAATSAPTRSLSAAARRKTRRTPNARAVRSRSRPRDAPSRWTMIRRMSRSMTSTISPPASQPMGKTRKTTTRSRKTTTRATKTTSEMAGRPSHCGVRVTMIATPPGTGVGENVHISRPCSVTVRPAIDPTAAPNTTSLR